jgi:hypothetical protein
MCEMVAPAGGASAAELASAKMSAAEVSAAHGATEVTAAADTHGAAEVAATTAAVSAATATSCKRVGRDGGASQRRRNSDDRDPVQYCSHVRCLSVRDGFRDRPTRPPAARSIDVAELHLFAVGGAVCPILWQLAPGCGDRCWPCVARLPRLPQNRPHRSKVGKVMSGS